MTTALRYGSTPFIIAMARMPLVDASGLGPGGTSDALGLVPLSPPPVSPVPLISLSRSVTVMALPTRAVAIDLQVCYALICRYYIQGCKYSDEAMSRGDMD